MNAADYLIHLTLSVVLIVGGYQFYFWCQRNPFTTPREFRFALDERIPFRPGWVWIYNGLYFPVILAVNLLVDSPRAFTHLAVSYLLLLLFQMAFFLWFPVVTPPAWRDAAGGSTWSERFLELVRRIDARSNSFPSMHASVAMLTALHLASSIGPWAFAFPTLIGLSCLYTKQHYVVDIPAGVLLGWLTFQILRVAA
jgi:membrane-associated phospholipid phosphatase